MCLLKVEGLKTYFYTLDGVVRAVNGVSFKLNEGETLGIVGESGCGKSVTALSILRLVPPPGRIVEGEVVFRGRNLLRLSEREMRKVRGGEIGMIFQEPTSSLNPVFTIENQIGEAIRIHQNLSREEVRDKTRELLALVGIPSPEERGKCYPHELSGGMNQRVMIAISIASNPSLLIADEPTTALDVTIQAQILHLLKKIQSTFGMAIILITHNLGIIAEVADKVAVMYAGEIVEYASTQALFEHPAHPYTSALLRSIPKLTNPVKEKLYSIEGTVPSAINLPSGCKFHPRCPLSSNKCKEGKPNACEVEGEHFVMCFDPL
jgi:oligopeptide/dipeptide ABC transporter ATP-binding protein